MYNGTKTEFTTSDLDNGLNRIRVSVGSSDGKYSELSDSIFITVEESDDVSAIDEFIVPIALIAILAITVGAVMVFRKGE